MLKSIFLFLAVFLISTAVVGQLKVETDPLPTVDLNKIALTYYKINFTKEQRTMLEGQDLEFIFSIDKSGRPTLEKVNGLTDPALLDSLKHTTQHLPAFTPRKVNGQPESGLYFLKLQFPKYQVTKQPINNNGSFTYREYELADFESIEKSGSRIDLLFGGAVNGFIGNASDYLGVGGGMKMDLLITGKKGIGGGLMMNFYGNKLKKDYPIVSGREQNSAPPTMMVGAGINKFIPLQERSDLNLQFEVCYAIQNITARLDANDEGYTQLQGFSPGLVVHYILKLGKDKPSYYYGSPVLANNNLNLHGAIRPMFLDLKETSGIMLEFGISYRMSMHAIKAYKLKTDVQN